MLNKWTTLRKLIWIYSTKISGGHTDPDDLPEGYRRVMGFATNDNCYWQITGVKLDGSDTVRLSFEVSAACNVFGCYTDSSAQNNYSLYASTASNAKYLRYNGGTYSSEFSGGNTNKRFNVVISPTGSSGMPKDSTWQAQNFTGSVDMCIGTSSTSASSAKLKGKLYGNFIVDGKFYGIPCERESDGKLGYYDTVTGTFFAPATGTPTSIEYADIAIVADV